MLFILGFGSVLVGFCFAYALLGYYLATTITDNTVSKNSDKYLIPVIISLIISIFTIGIFTFLTKPIQSPSSITYELIETNEKSPYYIIDSDNKYVFCYNKNGNAKFVSTNKDNVEIIIANNSHNVIENTKYSAKDLSKFWQSFLVFNIEFKKHGPLHITNTEKTYKIFIPENAVMQKE